MRVIRGRERLFPRGPVETSLADLPTFHMGEGGRLIPEAQHYLRLRNLPVNEHADTVLVVKLAFEEGALG